MVDFDKFEKQVKDKYGNQEFPFDEENWDKARKMIDASRQGKNRGGIFLLSAVAVICTTGLVYYFGFSNNNTALQKNNLASNQSVNSDIHSVDISSNGSDKINVNSNETSNEEKNTSVTETSSVNETSNTEHSLKSNSEKTEIKNNTPVNSIKTSETVTETKAKSSANSNNKNNPEEKTNNNPANQTKFNSQQSAESKKSTPVKSNEKTETPTAIGNNNNNNNNTIKAVTPAVNNDVTGNGDKIGNTENKASNPSKNNPVVTDSAQAITTTTVKPTKNSVIDSVPAVRKSRADSLAAMLPNGDGVSYATNVKEKHNAKNILFMEAGTTYLMGWSGGGKNEAGGFNLLAGINFQHYFTGTIAAQIGVQYSTISNLTNTTHTISTVKYDLGVEQDITSIKYQKLHYLVAPIKFTYSIKDKNIIGIGCNVAYLLNSDSKKEKYKTYSSDPNATKNNLTSTKETGYVEGFNPFYLQVAVSYRRKIYKGLSANAEFFYGLTDTKNNGFFKSNNFDRNVGFKVSLCYDLFKK